MKFYITFLCLCASVLISSQIHATQVMNLPQKQTIKITIDIQHIKIWNKFTDSLFKIHRHQLKKIATHSNSITGGYSTNKNYYLETKYYNTKKNLLLSKIQWEQKNKNNIHTIEVYIYNSEGKVIRDYISAYLPKYRNAPVQTLINIHFYNKKLHSYRQFDASGYLIYEQCKGQYLNKEIMLSIDEDEFNTEKFDSNLYQACFGGNSTAVDQYINPLVEIPAAQITQSKSKKNYLYQLDRIQERIEFYTQNILDNKNSAQNYLLRGDTHVILHNFFEANEDYTRAIQISNLDNAYYGRAIVKGRLGLIEDAIDDFSVYIQRKPRDSLAYSKRGIRYICLGDEFKAEQDLTKAIQLDPNNAEAHGDLGLIYASRGENDSAKELFRSTIKLDPLYRKAYHNLAMLHFINGDNHLALHRIDQAVILSPNARNSLLLKSEILSSLGRKLEANEVSDAVDFLPE